MICFKILLQFLILKYKSRQYFDIYNIHISFEKTDVSNLFQIDFYSSYFLFDITIHYTLEGKYFTFTEKYQQEDNSIKMHIETNPK